MGVGAAPAGTAKTCLRVAQAQPRPTLRGALPPRSLGAVLPLRPSVLLCPEAGKSEGVPTSLGRQRPHYLVLLALEACLRHAG